MSYLPYLRAAKMPLVMSEVEEPMANKIPTWSYGVTTVSERFDTYLLPTLESLHDAGFDKPHLFIDGSMDNPPPQLFNYQRTVRSQRVRTYGNWVLALWELYLLNPRADRYAVFQDDFLCSKNMRAYLDQCAFPDNGYWNLYTFPCNERPSVGWHLSNQLGKGALGLVFNRSGVQALLKQEHMVDRPPHERGWRNVDGAVVTALSHAGYKEWVHNPSLLQHEGDVSSINNRVHQKASTFRGVGFDCLDLLTEEEPKDTIKLGSRCKRIGVVGYHCACETGEMNLQLVNHLDVEQWMVKPHFSLETREAHPDVDTIVCYVGKEDKLEKFVRAVDVVVFVGDKPVYPELIPMCRKHNRRVVGIANCPYGDDEDQRADVYICTSEECYNDQKNKYPCTYIPWPSEQNWPKFAFEYHAMIRNGEQAITILPPGVSP